MNICMAVTSRFACSQPALCARAVTKYVVETLMHSSDRMRCVSVVLLHRLLALVDRTSRHSRVSLVMNPTSRTFGQGVGIAASMGHALEELVREQLGGLRLAFAVLHHRPQSGAPI